MRIVYRRQRLLSGRFLWVQEQARGFRLRAFRRRVYDDSGDPSDRTDDQGFSQKLHQDVAALCADGFAQADFSGSLCHRYQHDVHDADAPNEK